VMDFPHHFLMGGVWIEAQIDLIAVLFHPVEVLQQECVLESTSGDHVRTTVPHRSFPNRIGHTHPGEVFALTLMCGPVLIGEIEEVVDVLFTRQPLLERLVAGTRARTSVVEGRWGGLRASA